MSGDVPGAGDGSGVLAGMATALIRTAVPTAVGALVTFLAGRGVVVDDGTRDMLAAALVSLVTTLYYAGVTVLERKVDPRWGWLLGAPKVPRYGPGEVVGRDGPADGL